MKKGKNVMTITIGLICFILTYVIFIQFKTIEETNIAEIEALTETELREKIVSWKEKYEETYEKLQETKETIAEYRVKRESNQEATELLEKELLQVQILAGETDVRGEGILVTVIEKGDFRASHLLSLINELLTAGAEAISINDQRIINMSDIVDIYIDDGSHYIFVNKEEKVVSPYIIKAIGDPTYLESALTTKTIGFIDVNKEDADVNVEKSSNVKIPKYDGKIGLKYSKPKEAGK